MQNLVTSRLDCSCVLHLNACNHTLSVDAGTENSIFCGLAKGISDFIFSEKMEILYRNLFLLPLAEVSEG